MCVCVCVYTICGAGLGLGLGLELLKEFEGERLEAMVRGLLERGAVGRRFSFRRKGLEGRTGTEPAKATALFFRLDGGIMDMGSMEGMGSFSLARYTKCMA